MKKLLKPNSRTSPTILVAWRGKSQIDGGPIRVVVYCLRTGSKSRKTGPMVQVLICRDDLLPYLAVKQGLDSSVCGNCPLRPAKGGGCYCNLGAYYPRVWETSCKLVANLKDVCEAIRRSGLPVRIGSWGDPAAVPIEIIRAIVDAARDPSGKPRHTAYTHAWRDHPELRDIAMASVLSVAEKNAAERAGWRTLRIRSNEMPVLPDEIVCPASKEAGHKVTCSQCMACSGTGRKGPNVVIQAHGSKHKVQAVSRLVDDRANAPLRPKE